MGKYRINGLRMLGSGVCASASARHYGQRHVNLAAEHVVNLGSIVQYLVAADSQEAYVHEVDDGTKACCRRANACAHEPCLRNRRVADALPAKLTNQALGEPHRPPPGILEVLALSTTSDVLAHDDHGLVSLHFQSKRLVNRLNVRKLSNACRLYHGESPKKLLAVRFQHSVRIS